MPQVRYALDRGMDHTSASLLTVGIGFGGFTRIGLASLADKFGRERIFTIVRAPLHRLRVVPTARAQPPMELLGTCPPPPAQSNSTSPHLSPDTFFYFWPRRSLHLNAL